MGVFDTKSPLNDKELTFSITRSHLNDKELGSFRHKKSFE
jgi:hypothetical protein